MSILSVWGSDGYPSVVSFKKGILIHSWFGWSNRNVTTSDWHLKNPQCIKYPKAIGTEQYDALVYYSVYIGTPPETIWKLSKTGPAEMMEQIGHLPYHFLLLQLAPLTVWYQLCKTMYKVKCWNGSANNQRNKDCIYAVRQLGMHTTLIICIKLHTIILI